MKFREGRARIVMLRSCATAILRRMDLILWRHADAAPAKNNSEPDIRRRLTGKGRKQAATMAIWLERHLPDSVKVLSSPATRAQETAEALGRKFVTLPELTVGADAAQLLCAAGWPDNRHAVLIIGHQPALGRAASLLLLGEEQELSMRKAAVWWITNRSRDQEFRPSLRAAICPDYL
jgi:phosphohistidine phosphatase